MEKLGRSSPSAQDARRREQGWVPDPRKRRTLRFLKDLAIAGGFTAAASIAGITLVRNKEKGPANYRGEPIEGKSPAKYVTTPFGSNLEIPVRRDPSLSDDVIVGWTKPKLIVEAQEVYGPVYPTSEGNAKVSYRGRDYGVWYRLKEVPIFEKTGEGLQAIVGEGGELKLKNVYVAGNFIRTPTPQELSALPDER